MSTKFSHNSSAHRFLSVPSSTSRTIARFTETSSNAFLEPLRGSVVDGDVARVAVVVGAVASLVVATGVQDRLCGVTDSLAVELVFSGTVGGIDHVAVSNREFRSVTVVFTLVNPSDRLLAIGDAGRVARALAAL